jgi:hypothetical protein
MDSFNIYSWNTLHMIHEYNYNYNNSLVIPNFLNEKNRINMIVKRIKSLFDNNFIISLQEVNGDLLNELQQIDKVSIIFYKLERKPRLKNYDIKIYDDENEYLVILLYNKDIKLDYNIFEEQYIDPGKAALIIYIKNYDLCIINTHLPIDDFYGNHYNGTYSLELLNKYILEYNRTIINGDFNKTYKLLIESLQNINLFDNLIECSNFNSYTYKNLNKYNKIYYKTIDHFLLFTNNISNKNIMKIIEYNSYDDELSDHNLIYIKIN